MLGTEGANHPNPVNIADSWPIHSIVSEKYRLTEYGGGAWRPFVAPGLFRYMEKNGVVIQYRHWLVCVPNFNDIGPHVYAPSFCEESNPLMFRWKVTLSRNTYSVAPPRTESAMLYRARLRRPKQKWSPLHANFAPPWMKEFVT